jgi:hypothetical protein
MILLDLFEYGDKEFIVTGDRVVTLFMLVPFCGSDTEPC